MTEKEETQSAPVAVITESSDGSAYSESRADANYAQHYHTLGSVQLHNKDTGLLLLVPTPSNDPNDPLNWTQSYKWIITLVTTFAIWLCTFLAGGPAIAIVQQALYYFPPQFNPDVAASIGKVSYFYSAFALLQGAATFFWMPLVNKYGRRPIYLSGFIGYTACCIWVAVSKTYGSHLAGRIVLGFFSATGECLAPLTIADIWFLHERGGKMAIYTVMLSIGSALGVVFDGLVTISLTWQYMYYIGIALVGFCTILVFLFFPETSYNRVIINKTITVNEKHTVNGGLENGASSTPPKRPYKDNLRVFTGTYTKESLLKMFLRPLGLIIIPPVLWASLVQAVTIGFLVAVSTNLAPAYTQVYGFVGWQTGLCNLAAVIGSLCAIPFGGYFSDKVADYFTKRNGGIREPEHRLPAIIPALITGPLSLVLYGLGINNQYHWIVPTIGLGLINFTIVAGNNVVLVYCVDAYRPIAGEVVITQLGFKGLFGFLLSFYTNPWVTNSGYLKAFGGMAGISGAVIIWFIPLFFYGRRIRHAVYQWKILQWVKWDDDREKGE